MISGNIKKSLKKKIFFSAIKLKKTLNDLKLQKKKKIIMCHGVFDIVHPGHIRHLVHAKSKADLLIVSITADKHIKKGQYRPHVPQDLRAENLSAFSIVDFVLVDNYPTPLNNISIIKPNFFAKGFEYISSKMSEKTIEEEKTLKKYGGKIIFTPGDYVNSSSKLIEYKEPDLSLEKLLLILKKYKISFSNLIDSVKGLQKFKIHIFGDTIIDTFTHCDMIGGQVKTPTLSLLYKNHTNFLGGAGVVAKHVSATGAKTFFTTLLGNDKNALFVKNECKKSNIILNEFQDKNRPTVNKNLFISENHRLLKVGTLDNTPINKEQMNYFIRNIKNFNTDAIIFSDFRHGIFNKKNIPLFFKAIPKKVFKAADSQVASWWGNILDFQKFDLITPNEKEARFALSDQISGVRFLSSELYNKSSTKWLMLKLGKRGVLSILNKKHNTNNSYVSIDSFSKKVVDPVGAGDALLAYSTLSYLKTKNKVIASIIGTIAASLECELDGNIAIKPQDIINRIDLLKKKINFS